jgi:UDP-N-acetylglucosamine 2-epimerase (non-hydrolysing)
MAGVCFVVGARPNFVKSAPVYSALAELDGTVELTLVHTGQHYDERMSASFIEELDLPRPHEFLGVGSGSHAEQTARALVGVERVLLERRPSLCVVAGDVNSTLAGALAAAKAEVPVAHIESGLRSFDRTMPEEHNRLLTDHLSSILFVHSASAQQNLEREGIDAGRVHLVGNTMIDSLLQHLERARAGAPWERVGVEPGGYGLVTLHRPSLVDEPDLLTTTAERLIELAEELPLVFPVHPRTLERLDTLGLRARLDDSAVAVLEPLGYHDFLGLEAEARFVLTDSGGVQEETTVLGVRCFTLRDVTERPVTVECGTNTILGLHPDRIAEIPALLREEVRRQPIPLWDGAAGPRAAEVLLRELR